jgi:hypothetical protein
MTQRFRGNEYRTTVICVDSYQNAVLTGRFYNPACKEEIRFQSLSQLLVKMQDMLDQTQFPQSFTLARSFSGRAPGEQGEGVVPSTEHAGKLATFALRLLFRQNASWQGSVTWLEQGQEESFRSVLELILLLDSALSGM